MTKYFCDRCGEQVLSIKDLTTIGSNEYNVKAGEKVVTALSEICGNCLLELKNFLRPAPNKK